MVEFVEDEKRVIVHGVLHFEVHEFVKGDVPRCGSACCIVVPAENGRSLHCFGKSAIHIGEDHQIWVDSVDFYFRRSFALLVAHRNFEFARRGLQVD